MSYKSKNASTIEDLRLRRDLRAKVEETAKRREAQRKLREKLAQQNLTSARLYRAHADEMRDIFASLNIRQAEYVE